MTKTEFKYKKKWQQGQIDRRKVNTKERDHNYCLSNYCSEMEVLQISGNRQEVFRLTVTCCKSSLSDFSWATRALMQPFIEHKVAWQESEGNRKDIVLWQH